jgi:hypothetical protein
MYAATVPYLLFSTLSALMPIRTKVSTLNAISTVMANGIKKNGM